FITAPKRRAEDRLPTRPKGNYELSAVLAAADAGAKPALRPGGAAALAALQAALADLAGDLEELAGETSDPALWRRYLGGDRGVFARRLEIGRAHSSPDHLVCRLLLEKKNNQTQRSGI